MRNSTDQKNKELIVVHKAKLIIDANGYIYDPNVLKELVVGSVVRIFFTLNDPPLDLWSHDSPYVAIIEIDKGTGVCIGEILDLERVDDCDKYPLACGERIWFGVENIIEIPLKEQNKTREKKIKTYLTKNHVTATGPLYTVENISDIHADDQSDSDCDSVNSYSDNSCAANE